MQQLVCGHCGEAFETRTTGRPAKYCGGACRTAAHRERRDAQTAAAQLESLDTELTTAHLAAFSAIERAVCTARHDAGASDRSLLLDLVLARKAVNELADAANHFHSARALAKRHAPVSGSTQQNDIPTEE